MYFKLLEVFILKTMFNKGEYNFASKDFNPIKFFTILILFVNVIFTVYLLVQFSKVHDVIQKTCPQIFEAKKEDPKDIKKVNDKKP